VPAHAITVIGVIKNINSAQLSPSRSWARVPRTCCTVNCYATEQDLHAVTVMWLGTSERLFIGDHTQTVSLSLSLSCHSMAAFY